MPGPNVPFPPMEAELVRELPTGDGWQYEPKWDGFRGVLENDGGELALWSRNERPLLRYFPELRPLGDLLPPHSALDGEIVISRDGVLDFDAMQTRLHPAESRVRKLSAEIPAIFIAFDLLLWDGKAVHERPLEERREELLRVGEGFWISPATTVARGGDRVARPLRGDRARRRDREAPRPALHARLARGVVKVKEHKTADCVVIGVRWKEKPRSSRRSCSGSTARTAGWTTSARPRSAPATTTRSGARPPAPRRDVRAALLGAEPLGHGRPRGDAAAPRARGRGALRQGAGEPLPARHEADPLPRRQGSGAVHLARAPAAAARGRPDGRKSARAGIAVGMSDYTKQNLREVENSAPKFEMPEEMEARFARGPIEGETSGSASSPRAELPHPVRAQASEPGGGLRPRQGQRAYQDRGRGRRAAAVGCGADRQGHDAQRRGRPGRRRVHRLRSRYRPS